MLFSFYTTKRLFRLSAALAAVIPIVDMNRRRRVDDVESVMSKLSKDLAKGLALSEYDHLEQTTQPEPGNPGAQHDAMVQLGRWVCESIYSFPL